MTRMQLVNTGPGHKSRLVLQILPNVKKTAEKVVREVHYVHWDGINIEGDSILRLEHVSILRCRTV